MTERDDNRPWERRFLAGQPEGFAALYRQYGRGSWGLLSGAGEALAKHPLLDSALARPIRP